MSGKITQNEIKTGLYLLDKQVICTKKTLNSTTGVVWTHNLNTNGHIASVDDYYVVVTPTANSSGTLGEIYVTKALDSATIYCTGSTTTTTVDVVIYY